MAGTQQKHHFAKLVFFASVVSLATQSSAFGQSSSQQLLRQAVQEFRTGHQAQALTDFKTLEQSNPDNVKVHYFTAQVEAAMDKMSEAKEEFGWVATHGSDREKAMAQYELYKMSPAGKQNSATETTAAAGYGTAPQGSGKVRKIIEFYADW